MRVSLGSAFRHLLPAILAAIVLVLAGVSIGHLVLHRQAWLKTLPAVYTERLYRDSASPVADRADGRVTVLVFFDYNCPYCREGEPAIERLAHQPDVNVVMKELPLLGADSVAVAKLALAAKQQGGYQALQHGLFATPGRATVDRALTLAKALGLDTKKLLLDAQSASVRRTLSDNKELAAFIGVPGVPYYLVGNHEVEEGPDLYARLQAAVKAAQAKTCDGDDCGDIHAGLQ
jgi:protein-disulfide isomerase